MTAAVRIQPQGFSVQYPKTQWRVSFVKDAAGKFRFLLCGRDFKFEPRDRYRYPTHDDARRAAHCFLEVMKRLERSRMKLSILAEIGNLKIPQANYRQHEIWLVIDRTRYTWEAIAGDGLCLRSQYWYKHPDTAMAKAKAHINREVAITQIVEVVGWV
jgi:hypothetical protein